jgi:hypothetical protein
MLRISSLILIALLLPVLAACQTDKLRYNIGRAEPVTPPEGMFAANEDQQSKATLEVIYHFKNHPEILRANPVIAVQSMAYFEWLANDVRDRHDIPPQMIRELLDAGKALRDAFSIPRDVTVQVSVDQLWSMSRLLKLSAGTDTPEAEDISTRRRLLSKAKALNRRIRFMIREAREQAKAGNQGKGGSP